MFIMVLCACAKEQEEDPANTTAAEQGGDVTKNPDETTDKYQLEDNLPADLNYGGKEITILSRGRDWCRDEVSVSDASGEPINDAIYNRNIAVEDRLKIKINNQMTSGNDNYEITEMIRTQVQTGTKDYDMFANSVYATIMYTGDGLFQNLYECEYIDLDQPWWAQGFNSQASIGNAQYFATGAVCLSTYRFLFATFFNRNQFDANSVEYPYEAVRNGKWTLDYQYEISSGMYNDLNGDSTKDIGDFYGFVTNSDMIGVDAYWSSCKLPILTKNSDNWLEYSVDVERLTNAVTKINNLIWANNGAFAVVHKSADGEQEDIAAKFSEDTAAMVTLRLISVEGISLRDMKSDYGIVPMPKLDENQDGYYSYVHDTVTAYGIPVTTIDDNLQMVGAVLEALAAESYRVVTPAYYEIALKTKYVDDPESIEMLDLITESLYVDAGVLYTKQISSVHQKLRTFIGSNATNTVASTMKQMSKIVPKQLEKLQDGIKKVQEK